MFRCQLCHDFRSRRKSDTIKHEKQCRGRKEEKRRRHGRETEECRREGMVRSVVVAPNERDERTTDQPKKTFDDRKRKGHQTTGQRKEAKTDCIINTAGESGHTFKDSETGSSSEDTLRKKSEDVVKGHGKEDTKVEPSASVDGKRAGKPPTAVINPTPPRAQRRLKWPSLQQLLHLGSPLEERSASAERGIAKAERDEVELQGTRESYRRT
ncbi:hypothetical protein HOLleu_43062 [Holothuria leucospilota]|uniref:Uncharacterized protein n=1 Tax=Holothuria leucospilota TaxID=206669 RepID=A0A9Q0YCC3_HOLLE|nr:hypothetical protein HOLleu_43062 [Holothuria leucospilota]